MANVLKSVATILVRIESQFRPSTTSWRDEAVGFWIPDAIKAIGTYAPFERGHEDICVENFRVRFPCAMHELLAVEHNGTKLNLSQGLKRQNGGYSVNAGYIITPFSKGTLRVYYQRIPTDEKGLPMVLDNFYYQQALIWYCFTQMLSGGYKHPVHNFQSAERKWDEYKDQAANDMLMPKNRDEMEAFGNMWLQRFSYQDTSNNLGSGNEHYTGNSSNRLEDDDFIKPINLFGSENIHDATNNVI